VNFNSRAKTHRKNDNRLGNLGDSRRFHHGRAPLAFCKTRGLVLVGVNAAERFAIGIVNGNEVMMMLASSVFSEIGFLVADGFLGDFGCRFTQNVRLSVGNL
jgi:hypothetical protein